MHVQNVPDASAPGAMKRYHRTVRFRLTRFDESEEDELRSKLGEAGLRLERIRFEAHDVLLDVSLDADSAEEADNRALEAARFVPAWRVVIASVDPPPEPSSEVDRQQRHRHRMDRASVTQQPRV